MELHPKPRQPPKGNTWHLVEAYFSLCGPLLPFPSYMMSWGVPLCVGRKQDLSRKCDASTCSCTLFLFSLVSVACDCRCSGGGGPPLCRSVLRTVCCCDTPHSPQGLCVHSSRPPKNRESLWQHRRRRACDTPERFRSERVTPSPNLLSLRLLRAPSVTFSVRSHFHFWGLPLCFCDLLFLYDGLNDCCSGKKKQQRYVITFISLSAPSHHWLAGWLKTEIQQD